MLLGVSPQYRIVRNLVVVSGRFFDDQDALAHEKVAVIVKPFAEELYGTVKRGCRQNHQRQRHTVCHHRRLSRRAFDTYGESEISDHTMLVPYPVARYFTGTNTLKEIFFTMRDASMVMPAKDRILAIIRSRHYASSVYSAVTLTELLTNMAKIADMLTIVLTLGAGITLIVSGVGIMNSMLANVQSRIKEIGIRKALGATSREIRLQFLTEAVFLSLSGGIIGTLLGLAIPFTLGLLTPFKIPISPWSAVISLGHVSARRCTLRNAPGKPCGPARSSADAQVRVTVRRFASPALCKNKTHQPRRRFAEADAFWFCTADR